MRRKDREIIDKNEIYSIISKCIVCSIALNNGDYPYVIPMNFGVEFDGENFTLYFHSAKAGTKLELIEKDCRTAFEMHCSEKLILGKVACASSMEFESVCGTGTISVISGDEKKKALKLVMKQYTNKDDFEFSEQAVNSITILKLTVESIFGKRFKKA